MKNVGFYIVMPISLLVLPYVFNAAFDGAPFYFNKESGAVENITAILLAVAIGSRSERCFDESRIPTHSSSKNLPPFG